MLKTFWKKQGIFLSNPNLSFIQTQANASQSNDGPALPYSHFHFSNFHKQSFSQQQESQQLNRDPQPHKNIDYHSQCKYESLFKKIGLGEKLIKNTLANNKLTSSLANIIENFRLRKCEKKTGLLLYGLCSRLNPSAYDKKNLIADYIVQDKIKSQAQLDRAMEYLKTKANCHQKIDIEDFEKYCGVGMELSEEQIVLNVREYVKQNYQELVFQDKISPTKFIKELRDAMPAADGSILFKTFQDEVNALRKEYSDYLKSQQTETSSEEDRNEPIKGSKRFDKAKIFKVIARDMTSSINPPEILEKHLQATGGKIITRFPPEPNGYLHLGHAKAMRFSFLSAAQNEGMCNLRFDDTNPLTESKEYIDNIQSNVGWLGYTPAKVVHASDYFEQMHDFAIQLIKNGKAYICQQNQEEMQAYRKDKKESPFRNRSVDESLDLFDRMGKGEFEEGTYCLRLKIDYAHENPTLRDPVIYRIKKHEHPHTGNQWCIYPTYDFAHCLSDSIENVTHSLCSLEFEVRRDLYYWILEALNIYRPMVWEFSRLNISRTVLSKRKILKLIQSGKIWGWDDPRLLTINGMKRRGYTASGINEFCDDLCTARRGNENMISIKHLEHFVRKELDVSAPRTMAILDPVLVTLTNVKDDFDRTIEMYPFPKNKDMGSPYFIQLKKQFYIEKTDFRDEDIDGYYGLAPGKIVHLKYSEFIKCIDYIKDQFGNVVEIKAELVDFNEGEKLVKCKKCKGHIHWLSKQHSVDIEARLFDHLFKVDSPNEVENFLDAFNEDSLKVLPSAKMHRDLLDKINIGTIFQFERMGFFCVDTDSDIEKNKVVFNRTIELNDKDKTKILGDKAKLM